MYHTNLCDTNLCDCYFITIFAVVRQAKTVIVMCKKFVYGVAVSDYNFIGREVETKRLMNNFRGGINTILMSPRRLGKTSLVMRVCEKLKSEDIITIYLDIFG